MHISQFQTGDIIRHSTYERGVGYAVVQENLTVTDSEGVVGGEVVILIGNKGKPIHVAPGEDQWDDSQWAHVTAEWFTNHGKRIPKGLRARLAL